jgi:hypothetical protein
MCISIKTEQKKMDNSKLKLLTGFATFLLCQNALATLLDFTDDNLIDSLTTISNGYSGTLNGIGFTLTSDNGTVNFNERYDGSTNTGYLGTPGGALQYDTDGAAIDNDEITGIAGGNQTLTLTFDSIVSLSGFYFLDLYINPNESGAREQATISLDGSLFDTVDAIGTVGDGGYADLITAPILAQTIELSAANDPVFWDDHNNDYAFAGVEVSSTSVPEPHTIFLLGTGLVGLLGATRFKKRK